MPHVPHVRSTAQWHVPFPSAPVVEHHRTPLGIGEPEPRLSWTTAAEAGWVQRAYEVEVGGEPTGWVESDGSSLVPWPAGPLGSRDRRELRVRVRGDEGPPSPWSARSFVEAGLLRPSDWVARMVSPVAGRRPPLLRREFAVRAPIVRARLYTTAQGVHEVLLNGSRVGDEVLAPGWTSYRRRLRYRTHDVTGLLRHGRNALGVALADGWYRGRLGFSGRRALYGDRLAALVQLEVVGEDGSRQVVGTDERWRAGTGGLVSAGLYDGEHFDARRHPGGWAEPGFDDSGWGAVEVVERDLATLVAPTGPPVRRTELLRPVAVTSLGRGRHLLDFGQNLVGRLRLRVDEGAAREVVVRHAEVLEDGELCTRTLRGARATDRYAPGAGTAVWEPSFTYHGFRYAEVTGLSGAPDVVAAVCGTDLRRTGWFRCSDPDLERLHENVVWSARGNWVDVPTDCPQRDERLGWTGDVQVFAPAAAFLHDCAGALVSWLADLAVDQAEDGTVPLVVPSVPLGSGVGDGPVALWGDAAVLVPWVLWERFGDLEVLRSSYPSARAWVGRVERALDEDGVWRRGFQFGDWLDPAAPPDRPHEARTDPAVVATAYAARSARVLAQVADLIGAPGDAVRLRALARRVTAGFARAFPDQGGTQTGLALALRFGLVPARERARVARRLAGLVRAEGHRVGTGFAGTPVVLDALADNGYLDDAYLLLTQRECPSWLYAVERGATTVWERWDALLPDGRVNPGEMTSFNHFALGSVADWMHRAVAGLAPGAPGYRVIRVAPRFGGGLVSAEAEHLTPYGRARVAWRRSGERAVVDVVAPTGTRAVLDLPGAPPQEVGPGRHRFTVPCRAVRADAVHVW
ncbi:glycoside hydrolase family 78 protein [Actinosynnema pretiosum subsp. pretiosum]|uniref:alpha-L-rhamnosidase n=1 Tax=Actinosynnema pretiosum subsp. pretiosum TaxID=103721 RepID=A0AA45LBL3_9PSEU|nr:Alfa-L-rhamnosidase [Actinosynnema pretiosum subsp. pretiosum]QUF06310.1 glycoside hydrolase family 78 protein [Actinosynnema pretiosum subsp. pretiosum]